MYLKNTSQTVAVILNTVVGKIGVKPGEVVNIEHKILPPISDKIVKATEEEYISFRKGPIEMDKQDESTETQDAGDNGQTGTEDDVDSTVESVQTIIEDVSKTLGDNTALDFVKNLLAPKFEILGVEPDTDALEVVETDSKDEIKQLEKQIEDLKVTWKDAPTPKKKDKISKQIKELQKQLEKLSKNADE